MKWMLGLVGLVTLLAACGGGGGGGGGLPGPRPSPSPTIMQFYQPLAVGDAWTYKCYLGTPAPGASSFPKTNRVIGSVTVNGTLTYEYQEQIPSSPTQSTDEIQLLANDAAGDTLLYGYMATAGSSPQPLASPVVIQAASPGPAGKFYDYPAENGGTISRFYWGTGPTNPTTFGVYQVNEFFEGSHMIGTSTDGYGYAYGQGVMEEDHNFNTPNRIDCVISATPPP
ncbi:MAG TPA: hypothetical protein VKT51_04105 [Candidatus Eremiobacteraceae bacterium]|nr:hypothetical protein [Candidatus Eremiobacteraceae bacterium]